MTSLKFTTTCTCIFLSVCIHIPVFAQDHELRAKQNTLRTLSNEYASAFFQSLPLPSTEKAKDIYLVEQKIPATIRIGNDSLEHIPSRYNILQQAVELDYQGGIRMLPVHRIVTLRWNSPLNGEQLFLGGDHAIVQGLTPALYQVLVHGNRLLLKQVNVLVQPPTYNVALAVGERSEVISYQIRYYGVHDGVITLLRKPKDLVNFFGSSKSDFSGLPRKLESDEAMLILKFKEAQLIK